MFSSSAIKEVIGEIRSLTKRPFAVNLWVSKSDQRASRISADAFDQAIQSYASYYAELGIERPSHVAAMSLDFEAQVRSTCGSINGLSQQVIRTIGKATTQEEALVLEEAGLELIVASGFEGGGHRGSFLYSAADSLIGSFSLIPQMVDAVRVPVIAAGGIESKLGQRLFPAKPPVPASRTRWLCCPRRLSPKRLEWATRPPVPIGASRPARYNQLT